MSAKDLPNSSCLMDIECFISPKHIFGHKRKSITELESSICVKDMCLKNKDVLAASIVINNVTQSDWVGVTSCDSYIAKAAHSFACLDDIKSCPQHSGDCTLQAASCNICIFEGYYAQGLIDLSYFEQLIECQDKEIKDKLNKFNICILFMTICQLQEKFWNKRREEYSSNQQHSTVIDYPSYIKSLNEFLEMSEEEQMVKYNRMVKVYEFIQNPTKIEGIPWW